MTSEIFHGWLIEFAKKVTKCPLLLLDGHLSHVSEEVIRTGLEEDITIIKFPPHATDVLQPLDVSCFGPIKKR